MDVRMDTGVKWDRRLNLATSLLAAAARLVHKWYTKRRLSLVKFGPTSIVPSIVHIQNPSHFETFHCAV